LTLSKKNTPRQVLFASLVGTTIEFFDFYIYATAAVLVFPALFFPESDPVSARLASLATFAIAFSRGRCGRLCLDISATEAGRFRGRKSGLGYGDLGLPGAGADHRVDGGGFHGAGEVEALAAGAAHGFEFFELLGVFDALGDDIHAEGAGEREDAVDNEV
jgi:hypothetical protein